MRNNKSIPVLGAVLLVICLTTITVQGQPINEQIQKKYMSSELSIVNFLEFFQQKQQLDWEPGDLLNLLGSFFIAAMMVLVYILIYYIA